MRYCDPGGRRFVEPRPIPDTLPAGHDADEPLVADLLAGLPVIEAARAYLARPGSLQAHADDLLAATRPHFDKAAAAPEIDAPPPLVLGLLAQAADVAEQRGRVLGFADASDLLEETAQKLANERGPAVYDLLAELRKRFAQASVQRIGRPNHIVCGNRKV